MFLFKSCKFSQIKPKYTKLLINNEWVDSISKKTFSTENPATQETICQIAQAGIDDVELAVKYARQAFDGQWRKWDAYERGRKMEVFADLIQQNIEEIAQLETADNGKPIKESRMDLQLSIKVIRYYAGWADKIHGSVVPIRGDHFCYTRPEPLGVAGQIIPWNFPALMLAWKWAPVLATGCVSILKPAEQTPLSALRIGQLVVEAGFPPGVLQILTGYGDVGQALCAHKGIDKIAFTGSTEVGYEIMRQSHPFNLKRITLELGGKSPNIICHDADIQLAVKQAHLALFLNMGQCCSAGSRTYVHEDIYDEFVQKMIAKTCKIKIGDPTKESTQQGPQISQEQLDKILGLIDKGITEGAKLLTGGKRCGSKGYFMQPTIFGDCQDDMTIMKEEIFGPVMQLTKFKNYDDVIKRANNSQYGLAAGIVTSNIELYQKLANGIRAGTIYVNCYDVFDATTSFGGFKDSGIGRELGAAGLANYLEHKTVVVKRGSGSP